MKEIARLAELIRTRNAVDGEIAALTGRPALIGHVGEYIAARVFRIALAESAAQKGIDGHFVDGPLARASVNIKWYGKHEGILDMTPDFLPEYYLVLTGPRATSMSSRWGTRPWLIDFVFLFDAPNLLAQLRSRRVKIGIATSVAREFWHAAEVYPTPTNRQLILTDEQRNALALFGSSVAG
jgi:hypothetical protein